MALMVVMHCYSLMASIQSCHLRDWEFGEASCFFSKSSLRGAAAGPILNNSVEMRGVYAQADLSLIIARSGSTSSLPFFVALKYVSQ